MLQFETLLLKQLQRQQNRAEFCDIVLQTQGVIVPVHSCVLTAFSPWLCGVLSSVPPPPAGQRWLIELQCVEACTLLNLVSLLYSGQLQENREKVLFVANSLGIQIPQLHTEERHKDKEGEREDAGRLQEVLEEESESERKNITESSTQTEVERETNERDTQTDHINPDPQQSSHLIGQSTCSSIQELGAASDATVMLQTSHLPPEKASFSGDVHAVAPDTEACDTVSEPACVSQIYPYPFEPPYHLPPSTPITLPPSDNTFLELGAIHSGGDSGVLEGLGEVVEGFEQFEGNIPGFISYFLDSGHSQRTGRRGRGRPRGSRSAKAGETVRRARARSRGGGTVREEGSGRKRHSHTGRWGWAPKLARRGQGGGRVGRKLDIRPTGKQTVSLTRRRRGRGRGGALLEVGEGRGRQRQRGKKDTHACSEGQDEPPCVSSPRDHPHLFPVPLTPCSRSFYQNTVNPSDPSVLHTVSLPPAPQTSTQSVDSLLDDLMAGLHFLPPVPAVNQIAQQEFINTNAANVPSVWKTTYPSMHSSMKSIDAPQQHPKGELSDILDHFLNTFEEQVGRCGLDVGEETSEDQSHHNTSTSFNTVDGAQVSGDKCSNIPNTCTQLQPLNANSSHHCTQTSSTFTTCSTSQPNKSPPASTSEAQLSTGRNRINFTTAMKRLIPSWTSGSSVRLEDLVKECESRRMTRSQSRRRKSETTLQTHLKKKKKKIQQTNGSSVSPETEERRVATDISEDATEGLKNIKERHRDASATVKKKTNSHDERETSLEEENNVDAELVTPSTWSSQASKKSTVSGAYIEMSSSAFEKMRLLLESQRKRKEERTKAEKNKRMRKENESGENVEVQESQRKRKEEHTKAEKNKRIRKENESVENVEVQESQRKRKEEHAKAEKNKRIRKENESVGNVEVQESQRGRKEENIQAEKNKRIGEVNESLEVQESVYRAEEEHPGENASHDCLENIRAERSRTEEPEDEVGEDFEAQKEISLCKEREIEEAGKVREENEDSITAELDIVINEESSTLPQKNLLQIPESVESAQEEEERDANNNELILNATEIPQSTLPPNCDQVPTQDVLHSPNKDLSPAEQGEMLNADDLTQESGETTPTTAEELSLSNTLPCLELFHSHTPAKDLLGLAESSEEDGDVDVLEVSSSTSEPAVRLSVICCEGLTTEEEEEEEDVEVDVVAVDSD